MFRVVEALLTGKRRDTNRGREESVRLRPQSACLPKPRDFGEGVGDFRVGAATQRETWVQGKESDLKAMQSPRLVVSKRPASAGTRVVDTRTWSSTVVRPNMFRSRPQRPRDPARSGHNARSSPLTHVGQVAKFLSRKERERREHAERERAAAIKGRFEVIPVNAYSDEGGTPSRANVANLRKDKNVVVVGTGENLLSSVELERLVTVGGLMPDTGQQAFMDAWKPTGYGLDLSRYDETD